MCLSQIVKGFFQLSLDQVIGGSNMSGHDGDSAKPRPSLPGSNMSGCDGDSRPNLPGSDMSAYDSNSIKPGPILPGSNMSGHDGKSAITVPFYEESNMSGYDDKPVPTCAGPSQETDAVYVVKRTAYKSPYVDKRGRKIQQYKLDWSDKSTTIKACVE